jgi:two-component system chemotaxis response regulator CheY
MDGMEDIVAEFVDETCELLYTVSDDIMAIEKAPDEEVINRVYRAFHSVKGNASMLGFNRLSSFGHKAEDLLSLVRTGELRVDKTTADLLLHVLDTIRLILGDLRQGGDDARSTVAATELMEDIITSTHGSKLKETKVQDPVKQKAEVKNTTADLAKTVQDAPSGFPGSMSLEDKNAGFDIDLNAPVPEKLGDPEPWQPVQHVEISADIKPAENQVSPKNLKILIVEDEFTSRQMLLGFLSQFGVCHMAKDGLEAIDAFSLSYESNPPQPYDLICMDVLMPNMDGTRAARTIREIERGKGIAGTAYESAIIMTSAVNDPATIIKACYECGANYYFVKPLEFRQMTRQLCKLGLISKA